MLRSIIVPQPRRAAHPRGPRARTRALASFVDSDPIESAKSVGLRYVTDASPGIRRKRSGKGFTYVGEDGQPVRDRRVLARIASLAIPPAWTAVWISPTSRGHLQATGRDAKGRKQYRYHPDWRAVRDETKYHRMVAFGEALPRLRARVDHDLALPGLPREKVLAAAVRLLDETHVRVGNQEYARENESFGLTTLRNHHVAVSGATLRFRFRGKSGKMHELAVRDRRVARIVRQCQGLPGQELFQYLDETGNTRMIESQDVNDYLRSIAGDDFTAKDFRTWAGTVLTARTLTETGAAASAAESKRLIAQAIKVTAARLGNTPAICRNCYVHPGVLDAYTEGTLATSLPEAIGTAAPPSPSGLSPEEAGVLALLHRLESADRAPEERSMAG